jgi:hypothetical protein
VQIRLGAVIPRSRGCHVNLTSAHPNSQSVENGRAGVIKVTQKERRKGNKGPPPRLKVSGRSQGSEAGFVSTLAASASAGRLHNSISETNVVATARSMTC